MKGYFFARERIVRSGTNNTGSHCSIVGPNLLFKKQFFNIKYSFL
jgi:hypothetical protein